jgi:hypothetical protein
MNLDRKMEGTVAKGTPRTGKDLRSALDARESATKVAHNTLKVFANPEGGRSRGGDVAWPAVA